MADRLLGSLVVDIPKARDLLGWKPVVSMDEQLEKMAFHDSAYDVLLSFLGLVTGAPIFVVLWILGWLDTGSPLFRQERVGRHQKPFTLVKFVPCDLIRLPLPPIWRTHQP